MKSLKSMSLDELMAHRDELHRHINKRIAAEREQLEAKLARLDGHECKELVKCDRFYACRRSSSTRRDLCQDMHLTDSWDWRNRRTCAIMRGTTV